MTDCFPTTNGQRLDSVPPISMKQFDRERETLVPFGSTEAVTTMAFTSIPFAQYEGLRGAQCGNE